MDHKDTMPATPAAPASGASEKVIVRFDDAQCVRVSRAEADRLIASGAAREASEQDKAVSGVR